MTVKQFSVEAQVIYDLLMGKSIHRPELDAKCDMMMSERHFTSLKNITLRYVDENGETVSLNAAENSDMAIKMKIIVLFVQSSRYDYAKESRDNLKRKLGLDQFNCSNYMPEIIDGRTREWKVDNLEDLIKAFQK